MSSKRKRIKMKNFFPNLIKRWKKLLTPPNPPVPTSGIVRTGRAEVVLDKETGGVKWHTFGPNDNIGESMKINEPLSIPPSLFAVGSYIEIFEDIR
jgi:hypothetical protein